jgi:hypothetical protein
MSYQVMELVLKRSKAEGAARLVLNVLAFYASADGSNCFPGIERIAAMARLSERGAFKAIKDLEALGEVQHEKGGGRLPNGRPKTNNYLINVAQLKANPELAYPERSAGLNDVNPEQSAGLTLNNVHPICQLNCHKNREREEKAPDSLCSLAVSESESDQPPPPPPDLHLVEKKPPPDPDVEKLFDVFWAAFPNKQYKPEAFAEFKKLKPDEPMLQVMLGAIVKQKTWRKWLNGYIPNPARWLSGHGWKDEPQEKLKPARRFIG